MWTINDFPTYNIVSSLSMYGKLTCLYYIENNKAFALTNNGKTSFFLIVTRYSCQSVMIIRRVKNCMMWFCSTRALCLVFNLVDKSFLVLM